MTDDGSPRIVRLNLNFRPGYGRAERWSRVRPGMTLADLAALGIDIGEVRFLVRRRRLEFEPPLPARASPGGGSGSAPGAYVLRDRLRRAGRQRPCLRCRAPFLSAGPHNRLCDPCRQLAGQLSPLEPI